MTPLQGEIWWSEGLDKRRPVLIVTRDVAIPLLDLILVAPISRTIRQIPTEVRLGPDQGLPVECAANFDSLQPIRRNLLVARIGRLTIDQSDETVRALRAIAGG